MGFVLSTQAAPQYAELFQPLVQTLQKGMIFNPPASEALIAANTVKLTNYNATRKRLDELSKLAMRQIGCDAKDVCIDITSANDFLL